MNACLVIGLWDSPMEIILILGVILLLFGSKKLPEMARNLGKSLEEFKRAARNVQNEIANADQHEDHKPYEPAQPAALPAPAVDAQLQSPAEAPTKAEVLIAAHAAVQPPPGTVSQTAPIASHIVPVSATAAAIQDATAAAKEQPPVTPAAPPADTVNQNESHAEKTA